VKVGEATLTIRPYEPADESRVLQLLRSTLGEGPSGRRSVDFFRWKHERNPFGASLRLVAEADGVLVGFRSFLRWRLRGGERTLAAARAVDAATHPEHRRQGIFDRLTRAALGTLATEADLLFNTPNAKSTRGNLKLGWSIVGRYPVAVRVRNPLATLRRFRSAATGARRGAPIIEAPSAQDALRHQGLGPLLESLGGVGQRLWTPRDTRYLRWRYAEAPGLDYRAVTSERGGALLGLALFRVRLRRGAWEASIAEVLVPSGDRRTARHLLDAVAYSTRVDHLACASPSGSEASWGARRARFVRVPGGVRLIANPLRPIRPDPTSLRSWALSLGDLEVF
jgi:hypothetical protein